MTKYTVEGLTGTTYTYTYTKTYKKFEALREDRVDGVMVVNYPTGTTSSTGNTTNTYDENGQLIKVVDKMATDTTRDFIVDTQGRILMKTEGGASEYYFYANGAPVGSVGGTAADFDYNYTPVSPSYPASSPSNYVVNAGDTLQSIALAVFGDANLWYLIADANGLTSANLASYVGKTITIPNRITNIHNNYGTFKPYNPTEIVGDTTPTVPIPPPPPPPPHGGGCGGASIIIAIVAVVATVLTAGALAPITGQLTWAAGMSALGSGIGGLGLAGAASGTLGLAGFAVAGAVGSIAGQLTGMALGVQDEFSWGAVAAGALGAAATAGLPGSINVFGDTAAGQIGNAMVGAAARSVVSQGINIVTGQQQSFSWASVAVSAVSAPLSQSLSGRVEGSGPWASLARSGIGALTSAGTRAAIMGGGFSWEGVAGDALSGFVRMDGFGNAIGNSVASGSTAVGTTQPAPGLGQLGSGTFGLKGDLGAGFMLVDPSVPVPEAVSSQAGAAEFELSPVAATDEGPASGRLRNLVYTPGVDGGRMQRVYEIGGHFTAPQLIGQAFVGAYSPTLGRNFSQDDLNTLVAFSQLPDQLKDFDAFAAGIRYHNPFSRSFLDSDVRLLQESLHVLNSYGGEFNREWTLNLAKDNPGNLALAGLAMHPFADSDPHEGHGSIFGHVEESISGHSPDYMTPERAMKLVPNLTRYFEVVTGISADTVIDGYSESIGQRAKSDVAFALRAAGTGGVTGADFERQFNLSARSLLPEGALTLPTLPGLAPDYLWNNTAKGAELQTEQYLTSINLNANPKKFLVDALDSYVTIANRYLKVVGGQLYSGEVVEPIDRHRVLPNPSPIRPLVPNPVWTYTL